MRQESAAAGPSVVGRQSCYDGVGYKKYEEEEGVKPYVIAFISERERGCVKVRFASKKSRDDPQKKKTNGKG